MNVTGSDIPARDSSKKAGIQFSHPALVFGSSTSYLLGGGIPGRRRERAPIPRASAYLGAEACMASA